MNGETGKTILSKSGFGSHEVVSKLDYAQEKAVKANSFLVRMTTTF